MSIQHKVNVASAIVLVGLVAATPFVIGATIHRDDTRTTSTTVEETVEQVFIDTLSPCDEEDSPSVNGTHVYACIWDAAHRGNGVGRSFILLSR